MTIDTTKLGEGSQELAELYLKAPPLLQKKLEAIASQFLAQQKVIEGLEELLKTAADKLEVCKAHIQQMDSEYVPSEEMQMKYVNTQACIAIDAVVKAAKQGGVR